MKFHLYNYWLSVHCLTSNTYSSSGNLKQQSSPLSSSIITWRLQICQLKGSSDQFRHHFDSISTEDSEYHTSQLSLNPFPKRHYPTALSVMSPENIFIFRQFETIIFALTINIGSKSGHNHLKITTTISQLSLNPSPERRYTTVSSVMLPENVLSYSIISNVTRKRAILQHYQYECYW